MDFDQINELVERIGTIDVLVLNAGILHKPLPIVELDALDVENAFGMNVFGPLNMIKAFMKLSPRSTTTRRTIIYTSAYGIKHVMQGVSGYSESKAAMTYIMRCIDEETPNSAVRTFALHPAVAYTPMARDILGLQADSMPFDVVSTLLSTFWYRLGQGVLTQIHSRSASALHHLAMQCRSRLSARPIPFGGLGCRGARSEKGRYFEQLPASQEYDKSGKVC